MEALRNRELTDFLASKARIEPFSTEAYPATELLCSPPSGSPPDLPPPHVGPHRHLLGLLVQVLTYKS